jgi:hypothetical protein
LKAFKVTILGQLFKTLLLIHTLPYFGTYFPTQKEKSNSFWGFEQSLD